MSQQELRYAEPVEYTPEIAQKLDEWKVPSWVFESLREFTLEEMSTESVEAWLERETQEATPP